MGWMWDNPVGLQRGMTHCLSLLMASVAAKVPSGQLFNSLVQQQTLWPLQTHGSIISNSGRCKVSMVFLLPGIVKLTRMRKSRNGFHIRQKAG